MLVYVEQAGQEFQQYTWQALKEDENTDDDVNMEDL